MFLKGVLLAAAPLPDELCKAVPVTSLGANVRLEGSKAGPGMAHLVGILLAATPLPVTLCKAVPSMAQVLGVLHAVAPLPGKLCKATPASALGLSTRVEVDEAGPGSFSVPRLSLMGVLLAAAPLPDKLCKAVPGMNRKNAVCPAVQSAECPDTLTTHTRKTLRQKVGLEVGARAVKLEG